MDLTLEKKIETLIEGSLQNLGYEIVRILFTKILGQDTLQIMLDRIDGGLINVDDCEIASKNISAVLDVNDPIEQNYNLEVSSPGIERPLTREKDFAKYVGHNVKLSAKEKINGSQKFSGKITDFKDNNVYLSLIDSEDVLIINFCDIKSAKLSIGGNFVKTQGGKIKKKGKNKETA